MMTPRECRPHALVVEDDPLWGRLLVSDLERRCRVSWAKTLAGARRLLDDRVFDLVVTDLEVGARTGHGIPELARRFSPRTPVLLVSGHPSIARVAAEVRADAWIPKPVSLDVLRKTVSALLARRRRPARLGSAHAMALFDSTAERLDAASTFVAGGLRGGRRGVAVLARPLHAPMKALVLRKAGLDAARRFRVLSSESLLEQVIHAGTASRKLFSALTSELLAPAGPLSLFGDAVDHLVLRGAHRAAVQLETLWNEALPSTDLEILCGYTRAVLETAPCACHRDLAGLHPRRTQAV